MGSESERDKMRREALMVCNYFTYCVDAVDALAIPASEKAFVKRALYQNRSPEMKRMIREARERAGRKRRIY